MKDINKALELIKASDQALYNWIMANGRGMSNQTILLYAEHLTEENS